ncbi:unnamed protein product [Lactuca virosa]|uniref:Uncharacterized protein n=1 Tax=Lactuca virosa TaxID=75947 RepID=A0AAU9NHM4_9ASTR|nr:unnamed protein product [Lactuca virosa]
MGKKNYSSYRGVFGLLKRRKKLGLNCRSPSIRLTSSVNGHLSPLLSVVGHLRPPSSVADHLSPLQLIKILHI